MGIIEPFKKPIYIIQPLLPDIKDVNEMIETIWNSNILSNNGNMVKRLESELAKYLNVSYLSLFSNGTVALQLACKVLRLSGEVITTPFTFAATAHSLAWNNIKPVFDCFKRFVNRKGHKRCNGLSYAHFLQFAINH